MRRASSSATIQPTLWRSRSCSRPGFPSPTTSRSSVEAESPRRNSRTMLSLAFGRALLAGGVRLRLGRRLGGALRCLLALRHLALGQLLALFELLFLGLRLDDLRGCADRGEHRFLGVVEVG